MNFIPKIVAEPKDGSKKRKRSNARLLKEQSLPCDESSMSFHPSVATEMVSQSTITKIKTLETHHLESEIEGMISKLTSDYIKPVSQRSSRQLGSGISSRSL
jgi:hypothetical protein